ncbi:Carnitine O-acetyltransferase mitochondrial, partial [Dimargaris xerosporica]
LPGGGRRGSTLLWSGVAHLTTASAKTFENQASLPRLPIPTLHATAERYLKSLAPVSPSAAHLARSTDAVRSFVAPGGLGEELQRRLHAYDQEQPHSWLEDLWLRKGYVEWREPIFINVSWWAQFADNPVLGVLRDAQHPVPGTFTEVQLERASGLIQGLTLVNDALNRQAIPSETTRRGPLCMNQFKYLFGTSRIPTAPYDRMHHQYPCNSDYIIVMARDQLYQLPVLGPNKEILALDTIKHQLHQVVDQVTQLPQPEAAVGVLTTTDRDTWTEERLNLAKLDPRNAENLSIIDNALFVVCLDDAVDPSTATDLNRSKDHFFHNYNGRNRWLDKSMQVIVLNNGRAGLNGEHTPSDAATPGTVFNHVISHEGKGNLVANGGYRGAVPPPQHLRWQLGPKTAQRITDATARAQTTAAQLATTLLHFDGFGSEWVKRTAGHSPDSFFQMVLQLAYYRLHRAPCPTYETAGTRAFLHGRTETVRSCSSESLAFTQKFVNPQATAAAKLEALDRAIASHREYIQAASNGQGVDRHLLGLRCMIENSDEQATATLFTDPAYAQSMSFRLSTSNMSPGTYFYGGFAPVVSDGYGISYSLGADQMKLSISNWKSTSAGTDCQDLKRAIAQSLEDLHQIITATKAV